MVTERGLICVGDVEEAVVVLALVVDLAHEGITLEHVLSIDEEVEGVLLGHLYAFTDNERELVCCEVIRHQVPDKYRTISHKVGRVTYLFLSMSGSLLEADFSQMIGMRSGYCVLIFSLCSLRWSAITHQVSQRSMDKVLTEVRVLLFICFGHIY